jgi:pyruvate, water dikinase
LPDARYIRSLDRLRPSDALLAGSKAAALGELTRAGFSVPPGFVVTTAAHVEGGGTLPRDAADEIRRSYRALGSPAVAVRSSGTSEDLPGASFAGQHDTLLDVRGEDHVLSAVVRCWASMRTDRAERYRAHRGLNDAELALAVIVQAMAPCEVSGVVFTVNPISGQRDELLVNAARGSGEAVVGGEVVPDQWVARRPDGAVIGFVPAPHAATHFLRGAAIRGALSSGQVRELAQIALRAEEHFGVPQDVEWSFGQGAFHVLQSRPITTLGMTAAEG